MFLKRYPLLYVLAPFVAGILFAMTAVQSFYYIAAAVLSIFVILFLFYLSGKRLALMVLICSVSFFAGTADWSIHSQEEARLYEAVEELNRLPAVVRGTVVSIPVKTSGAVRFEIEPEEMMVEKKFYRIPGKISVSLKTTDLPRYGDRIQASGTVYVPSGYRNFKGFDYGAYMREKGISLVLTVKSRLFFKMIEENRASTFLSFIYSFREKAIDTLNRELTYPLSPLCAGILFGERATIPDDVERYFKLSGTYHLFAISGFNIGILSLACFMFFRLIGLRRKTASVPAALMVVLYSVMTGMGDSVKRAMIMALTYFAAILLERERDILNSLFVSLLIILVLYPGSIDDAGFLLTFTASFFLITCTPVIYEKLSFIPSAYLRGLVSASIAAQAGVMPVLACFFNYVSVMSVFANIIAVPIAAASFVWGIISVSVSSVFTSAGSLFCMAEEVLLYLLLECVKIFSDLPLSYIRIISPGVLEVILYYIITISLFYNNNKKSWKAVPAIAFFVIVSIFVARTQGFLRSNALTVTMLDVGEAEAMVIESPRGGTFMIDTGGTFDNRFDVGENIIIPYLLKNGISSLDAVFITHPHPDHMYGLSALAKGFDVGKVYMSSCFSPYKDAIYRTVEQALSGKGIEVKKLTAGDRVKIDDIEILAGYPDGNDCGESFGNINNLSLVLKVNYAGKSMLFTGDVENPAIDRILERNVDLGCDVVKVPHHGGRTSAVNEFFKRTGAGIAVVSVGKGNSFGHPSKELLEIMDRLDIKLFRTDLDGAIKILFFKDRIEVKTYEGKEDEFNDSKRSIKN